MRKKVAYNVYLLILNIPISFFLSLVAAIRGATIIENGVLMTYFNQLDWLNILYNFLIGLVIGMLVGNFVPLTQIGRWFAKICHVRNDTFKGNIKFRLVSELIISAIYFIAISPALTLFNWAVGVYKNGAEAGIGFLLNMPFMFITGYFVALVIDYFAYKVAKKIDKEFHVRN